jgi:hypothetical protein
MKLVAIAVLVVMVCGSTGSTAMAQEPPPQAPSPTSPKKVQNLPLELQVIISRYQGEKRISSLPYCAVAEVIHELQSRGLCRCIPAAWLARAHSVTSVRATLRREAGHDDLGELRERRHEYRRWRAAL